MYVLFRDDASSKKEVYLSRNEKNGFSSVGRPEETSIQFDTAREAYDFAGQYPVLQYWRVGYR